MSQLSKPKAIKVTKSTPETQQLEVFIAELGVEEKAELYLYNNKGYININIVLPVLSVQLKWFLKESEHPTHYISINKAIYVNKYGLTKLLAQSKEAVAFQLQDYIYEVIYKLETNGQVSKEDITTRIELNKTLDELQIYKTVESKNQMYLQDVTEELNQLRVDYSVTDEKLTVITDEYHNLLESHKHLTDAHSTLTELAKKLARYVRIKKPNDLILDHLDGLADSDGDSDPEASACKAKTSLTYMTKQKISAQSSNSYASTPHTSTPQASTISQKPKSSKHLYYVMRSSSASINDAGFEVYTWHTTKELPIINITEYTDFKKYSCDYRLNNAIFLNTYPAVWYADTFLTQSNEKIFNTVLRITTELTEPQLIDLLNVFERA